MFFIIYMTKYEFFMNIHDLIYVICLLSYVDAPDEVRLRQVDDVHEVGQLLLELGRHRVLFLLLSTGVLLLEDLSELDVLPEEVGDELVAAVAHDLDDVVAELVLVLVQEGVGAVADGPGEVLNDKPRRLGLDLVEALVALSDFHFIHCVSFTIRHHIFTKTPFRFHMFSICIVY